MIEIFLEDNQIKVPRYLYHVGSIESRRSILKRGIIPSGNYARPSFGRGSGGTITKARSEPVNSYESRVYLSTIEDDILFSELNWARDNDGYIEYRIDTSKFDAIYYEDKDSKNGVYTLSKIPATAISIIKTVPKELSNPDVSDVEDESDPENHLITAGDFYKYHLSRYKKLKHLKVSETIISSERKMVLKFLKMCREMGEDFVVDK